MKQADLVLNLTTKRTRKREFLAQMERVVPWPALVELVGSSKRWWLNHETHSRVANSTASRVFQGPRRWMISALYSPLTVSASALS